VTEPLLVLFGATGDLSKKKLLPALRNLHESGDGMPVLLVSRKDTDIHGFIQDMGISDYPDSFLEDLYYVQKDVTGKADGRLRERVREIEGFHGCDTRLFYLALPYFLFEDASSLIDASGLKREGTRVAFEKPFGDSLESARDLLSDISRVFDRDQVYLVDHYLGKEAVEDLLSTRFGSDLLGAVWNGKHADSVQVLLSEDFGPAGRTRYYDSAGAIRDVVQSHLLQAVSLATMRPPESLSERDVREAKLEALRSLELPETQDLVVGQYASGQNPGSEGYRELEGVEDGSTTETFAALRFGIDSPLWPDTDIYLKTGKMLDRHEASINLVLKEDSRLYDKDSREVVTLRMHPTRGLRLRVAQKGSDGVESVRQDVVHTSPDSTSAYENIFSALARGDHRLFVSQEFMEESWRITDSLVDMKQSKSVSLPDYAPGTKGPEEAERIPERHGDSWVDLIEGTEPDT
jgi:glucose-6-phosphate 1-dehydrogenase